MPSLIIVIGVLFSLTFVAAFGALFFKRGAAKFSLNIFEQIKNTNLIIGAFLFGAPTLVYVWALSFAPVSLLYPLSSITYVWVALLSVHFLGERMNKYKWIGIGLIISGVSLITYSAI